MTWAIINGVLTVGLGFLMWWKKRTPSTPGTTDGLDVEGLMRLLADLFSKLPHDSATKADLLDELLPALRGAGKSQLLRKLSPTQLDEVMAAFAAKSQQSASASASK